MRRHGGLLLLLVVAVAALAGCQSQEERAYVGRVNVLSRETSAVLADLDADGSTEENGKVIAKFAAKVKEFRRLDPPASVEDAHSDLVAALEHMQQGLLQINAEPGDAKSVDRGLAKVQDANDELEAAVDELDRKL